MAPNHHSKQQQQKNQKQPTKMLSKMMDAAFHKDVSWNQVIHYIDSHCILDESLNDKKLNFEAPLAASAVPTESLFQEMDYTLLKRAVLHAAPVRLIAAICQLAPHLLAQKDAQQRTVLHHACRYPPTEHQDQVLLLLVAAHRAALVQGDAFGRTPLHYLLWYHAEQRRNLSVLQAFLTKIPTNELDDALVTELTDFTERTIVRKKQRVLVPEQSPLSTTPRAHNHHNRHAAATSNTIMTTTTVTMTTLSAARIPDLKHGCFPIHYATVGKVHVSVLQLLLQADPQTKHCTDKYDRTPLHWYLGAGYLPCLPDFDNKSDNNDVTASTTPTHVSGERMDPQSHAWHETQLDEQIVKLLVSSRVARTKDSFGRTPLHWAAQFWACHYYDRSNNSREVFSSGDDDDNQQQPALAVTVVKTILDHHINQLTTQDARSMTPLMVLLDCTAKLRRQEHEANVIESSLSRVVTKCPPMFNVPSECVKVLLEHPDYVVASTPSTLVIGGSSSAMDDGGMAPTNNLTSQNHIVATLEDDDGRLPIHIALQVAAPAHIVQTLFDAHPTALLHATEELVQVPLHCALSLEYTAPQQSKAVMELLLQSMNVSKHGTVMDGRLALKMEDANGYYPLHYACQQQAPQEVIECILHRYPQSALLQLSNGNLPVHALVNEQLLHIALSDFQQCTRAEQDLLEATRQKLAVLLEPLLVEPAKLKVADAQFGMLPLHLAVLFQATTYPIMLRMLQLYPEAAATFTTHPVHSYSCLDLHDIHRTSWRGSLEEWQLIKELLFAFGPCLDSHRHDEELLSQCVLLIVEEVRGEGSRHLQLSQTMDDALPELELTHTLSNLVAPSISSNRRNAAGAVCIASKHRTRSKTVKPLSLAGSKEMESTCSRDGRSRAGFSQYDDNDLSLGYDTAAVNTELVDEDESYFSGDESSEEEIESIGYSGDSITENQTNAPSMNTSYTEVGLVEGSKNSNTSCYESALEPSFNLTVESCEMQIKIKANEQVAEEEKKSDDGVSNAYNNPEPSSVEGIGFASLPLWASEVAMRLWTFFALYRNARNPSDTYAKQVNDIIDQVEFPFVQELMSLQVPSYATNYIDSNTPDLEETVRGRGKLTYRDASNPKCRELLHKRCHFLGRFDFSGIKDILVKRDFDDSSLVVRAYEWTFTTETATDAAKPGISEATIWTSGEVPADVGLTFRPAKRLVLIKFTKVSEIYYNETECRRQAGIRIGPDHNSGSSFIIPIEHCYNGQNPTTKDDRMYRIHVEDPRFRTLDLSPITMECIDLADYPYALVYADAYQGSIASYLSRRGSCAVLARNVATDVAEALQNLHAHHVVNASLVPSSITLSAVRRASGDWDNAWLLSDFSQAALMTQKQSYLGGVSTQGFHLFTSCTLPPEMFIKLSNSDLKLYQSYWREVQETLAVPIPPFVIAPKYNIQSGEAYVVKCHFVQPAGAAAVTLPKLPYKLVPASTSTDLWSFGLLLFELCAGRPLFPYDGHACQVFEYDQVCTWNLESAQALIYKHITDIAAQDLLLHLLCGAEKRSNLELHETMAHPFFAVDRPKVLKFEAKHRLEAAAIERRLIGKALEAIEREDLERRTTTVMSWDFALLERLYFSTTQLMRRMLQNQPWREPNLHFPCSTILLPYNLKEQESCTTIIEKSQALVAAFLRLSQAVLLTSRVKGLCSKNGSASEVPSLLSGAIWTALGLQREDFAEIETQLALLASHHVELCRNNPTAATLMVVKRRIDELVSIFNDSPLFLYLIDEYNGIPLSNEHYPLLVASERKQDFIQNGILMTYLMVAHTRCRAGGLQALAKLTGLRNEISIPETWIVASQGLLHELDERQLFEEIIVLQDALTELYSARHRIAADDLDFMRNFIYEHDPTRNFADLQRVSVAEMVVWTTRGEAQQILESSRASTFTDALAAVQSKRTGRKV
ncbi:hypothetical protein MPSEU_000679300 [Mayamaea pseudoterrestris]|nr:hypothetical protein MPSEU_000679300 [Mayamaea pseudoterrestris]